MAIKYMAMALCALTAFPAFAQESDGKTVIVPEAMQQTYENFQYAPAVRAGDMLYLSGVVVMLKKGESTNDITPAVTRAFDEIDMILAKAGADWSDVVDVTSYLTNLDRDIGAMWQVKQARVPAPYPAWSAIGTNRLFGGDNAIIEIKVTAYLPQKNAMQDKSRDK